MGEITRRAAITGAVASGVAGGSLLADRLVGGKAQAGTQITPHQLPAGAGGDIDWSSNSLSDIAAFNGLRVVEEPGTGGSTYAGSKVNLTPYRPTQYTYDSEKYCTITGLGSYNGHAAQGFTVFENTGFEFYDQGYCRVIDLAGKTILGSYQLPTGVAGPDNHAGQANFLSGTPDGSSPYPLLLLSSYLEKTAYVMRMFSDHAELVQKVTLVKDDGTNADCQAFFPDLTTGKIIVKLGATDQNGAKYKYYQVYDLPEFGGTSDITLLESQMSDQFYVRTLTGDIPASKNFVNAGFAQNGKLIICAGFSGAYSSLLVIDYEKHAVATEIRWSPNVLTDHEQEQCALFGASLLINYNGADYLSRVTF